MESISKENFLSNLFVILVIYKTKISDSPTYRSLSKALQNENNVVPLFIFDNSPEPQIPPQDSHWEITYKHDQTNPGVSKAYNVGFTEAKDQNKKWMLLVDQDTIFSDQIFGKYLNAVNEFRLPIVVPILKDNWGIVSPLRFYFGGGRRIKELGGQIKLSLKNFFFHNSGLLVSVDQFEAAGGYDENLRLDFTDFSFVCRLRKENDFFAIADITCNHSLAATSDSDKKEKLVRLKSYLASAKYFKRIYDQRNWMLPVRLFFRAIKLSLKHKDSKFILLYFEMS